MPFGIQKPIRLSLLLLSVIESVIVSVLYSVNGNWKNLFGTVVKANSSLNETKPVVDLTSTLNDVLLLTYIKTFVVLLLVVFLMVFPRRKLTNIFRTFAYWVVMFIVVLLACKVTLFDDTLSISYIPIVALGLSAFEFLLLWKTYSESRSVDEEDGIKRLSAEVEVVVEISENSEPLGGMQEENKSQISLYRLLTLLKPYFWPKGVLNKIRCVLTWVFVIISRMANLYAPIFIGRAVSKLSDPASFTLREIYIDVALFCMITLIGKYSGELVRVVYLRVKQVAYVEVAEETFRHLHSLSLEWHLKKKMGSILRSLDRGINAANTVVSLVFLRLLPSVGECIAVFVIFYTTFDLPLLSATVLLSTVLYIIVTVQVTLWRKKFRVQTNKHDNQYHDKASDSIINYETVKYFTAEEFEVKRYVDSIEQYQVFSKCTEATLSLLNMSQQTIIQMTLFSCLYIVTTEIFDEDSNVSVGDFVTVQVYIMNLFAPLSFLGTIYNTVIQSFVDMTNLSELLGETPDIVDGREAKPIDRNRTGKNGLSIRFDQVWFSYPSNPTSGLKNVSFVVPAGTTTAIVGHTGAGKSTISRLLFRFYDPKEGGIFIDDKKVTDITQLSLRQNIGVVPQDTVLFNESIYYNILYGRRDASMKDVEDACRAAQILDFIHSLPEGFDTMVGERGLKLSGGEKQRVAIARCLLKNPPIVLLDEATSALDTRTEKSVQEALNNLTISRTTVVIAHRLSTIRDAEQIIVLDQGEIVEKGSHPELLNLQGEYAQMWAAQRSKDV